LFALDEIDLKPLLRTAHSDESIQTLVRQNVWDKWAGHEINSAHFVKPERTMHAIGG
jgi:cyclic pyranopterin phosphate synthase